MKMKSISALALSTLLLFSCSKDEGSVPGESIRGKETLVQVSLNSATATTRSNGIPPTEVEKRINEVRLYIFDSVGVLEAVEDFEDSEATKTFKLTTGRKTFLAAVNFPLLPAVTVGGTTLTSIRTLQIPVTEISAAALDGNFWMTSLDGGEEFVLEEIGNANDVVGSSNDITLKVGRAVAKVGVNFRPTSQTDGELRGVEYKMHNNPNAMMLFYSVDNTQGGILKTPYYAAEYVAVNYFANNPYLSAGTATTDHIASYMTENSNLVPTQANSTFAMIRGVFVPDSLYDSEGGNRVAGVEGTFYRIRKYDNNGKYTYTEKYYSATPSAAEVARVITDGSEHQIFEYTNGFSYYGLWIDDRTLESPLRSAVKRNTYWNVTITHVNGAGEPDENSVVDPDENLNADTWLTAKIEVMDWTQMDQLGGI